MKTIYLKLVSTTYVKIHQLSYVIFETISHCSRHNSPVFAHVPIHQIPHVIFQTKRQFSFKFGSFFIVMRYNSSVHFQLKLYMLLTKRSHQSASFATFNCSQEN